MITDPGPEFRPAASPAAAPTPRQDLPERRHGLGLQMTGVKGLVTAFPNGLPIMDADRPIKIAAEDRLGFAPVARHLAQVILDQSARDGLVFGIEGEWGSHEHPRIE